MCLFPLHEFFSRSMKVGSVWLLWYLQPMSLFFWPSRHNFLDIELKFDIIS